MRHQSTTSMLAKLWGFNVILLIFVLTTQFGVDFFKSSVLEYSTVKADPFNGTVSPIAYVPNWLTTSTQNKSLRFDDVPLSDFIEIPEYNAALLEDGSATDKMTILERAEYFTPYMGSYRMNYQEYDGSHLGIDIRAPLGTPVRAIANGVVVKVNNAETSDGKYVIIRHENVSYEGETQNLYSEYLHLESANIEEGTKVQKGQVIGKVGMTGITTTPHLHLQIDKESAPFHTYWPYSYKDLADLGIDFFEAVNRGVGKENAIKYTIHPLEFVQKFENGSVASNEVLMAGSVEKPSSTVETPTPAVTAPVVSAPVITPSAPVIPQTPSWVATANLPFSDVSTSSAFYDTTKYLFARKITTGFPDGTFRPMDTLTRRGAVLFLGRTYQVAEKEYDMLPFADVSPTDLAAGYLGTMVDQGIVTAASEFRPDATMTRGEAILLMVKLARLPIERGGVSYFRDISKNDPRAVYFNAFSKKMGLNLNMRMTPDTLITRGEFVNMLVGLITKQ